MNPTLKIMTLGALCLWSSGQQAFAQTHVDLSKLPPAQNIYRSPVKIQIVPDGPQITSVPAAPPPNKVLVIQMPQAQAPATEMIYVNAPGGGGGISGLPPGTAAVNLSQPPASRFGSNIPNGGFASARNLPAGQSSNGLNNKKFVSGQLKAPAAAPVSQPLTRTGAPNHAFASAPLIYQRPGAGDGGSGSSTVTTQREVKGEMKRRTLLNKTD
ncbi:MAG: hypothetical protein SGJ27_16065 [Candidatus Melainabacteria bacterium]|nr:hypothetical protein [Candidatus Melainabacteria bacterium]